MPKARSLFAFLLIFSLPCFASALDEESRDYFASSSVWEKYSDWRGYWELSILVSPHQWGKITRKDKIDDNFNYPGDQAFVSKWDTYSNFRYGFRIGAMYVVSENFHLGGFWTLDLGRLHAEYDEGQGYSAHSTDSYSLSLKSALGVSMKAGGRVGNSNWLGFGVDLGLNLLDGDVKEHDVKPQLGLGIMPKMVLDWIFGSDPSKPRVISAFTGAHFGYAKKVLGDSPESVEVVVRWIMLTIGIGFNVG